MTDPKPTFDLKHHPIVVGAAAALAVFGATVTYFTQVAIPIQTAQIQNDLVASRAEVATLQKQNTATAAKIDELNKEVAALKARALSSELNLEFAAGNPYPPGLGLVKMGDALELIAKYYPETSIEKRSGWWSIKVQHAVFRSVTFYFDRSVSEKDRRVTQLLLLADSNLPPSVIPNKIVEAFGQPYASGPKKDCYKWKVGSKLFVAAESTTMLITYDERGCWEI